MQLLDPLSAANRLPLLITRKYWPPLYWARDFGAHTQ
jgi:hypothetical protein